MFFCSFNIHAEFPKWWQLQPLLFAYFSLFLSVVGKLIDWDICLCDYLELEVKRRVNITP